MTSSPRRSFSCEDLTLYRSITDLRCSPSGDEAVYTVHTVDREGDSYQTSLWLVSHERGEPRELVSGESALSMPRWLPNGKGIAFITGRSGSPQVHVLPRDGGEAYQLTRLEGGLGSYAISADGRWLLAVSQIPSGARSLNRSPSPTDETGAQLASMAPFKSNGVGFVLDKQPHLFVVDLQGGDPKQITSGDFEVRSAEWSPDGTRIAYVRTREGRQTHRTDLWIVGRDGKNARQVSDNVASAQTPLWSPDGSTVAFAGGEVEGEANVRWWRYDVEQDRVQPFGPDSIEVVQPQGAAWSAGSSHLTFVNARHGRQEVASLGRDDEALRTLVRGEDLQVRKVSATERHVVFVSSRLTEPCELYVAGADGSNGRRVTDLNGWWRERRQPVVKLMQFTVPDGDGGEERIDGWLVVPEDAGDEPLPLLFDVHGGPQSYVDLDYVRYVHWSVLWSRGWAILATNGAGSSSYGPHFARRVNGRWGELCFPQHMTAIHTLQEQRRVDDRIVVTGKSYGGFLSAWAIGHTDDFKAAIVAAPVTNLQSHFGTSDSGYYVTSYALGGEIWERRDVAQRLSPVNYAHLATTPTLILQGEDDQRCPRGQSEELFATIIRAGDTPVELVLYQGEHHGIAEAGKPSNRIDYFRRLVDWGERWTMGAEDQRPSDSTPKADRQPRHAPVAEPAQQAR